ncbi:MAG: hypothetical protein QOJ59_2485 [Thermomicrobiales bacterium]|nr:hypothetical protein [Thermomicrobiales bacterium]
MAPAAISVAAPRTATRRPAATGRRPDRGLRGERRDRRRRVRPYWLRHRGVTKGDDMDGDRFDQWVRILGGGASRRTLLKRAAGAAGAGLLAFLGAGDADAAGPCQVCHRGTCKPRNEGRSCADCGFCHSGVCVASPTSVCGNCANCNAATLKCEAINEGNGCGTCGVCANGKCAKVDVCDDCSKCKRSGRGRGITYDCASRCGEGKDCCPGGRCISEDTCCEGYKRCPHGGCCPEAQECTAQGCCDPPSGEEVCGTGDDTICCRGLTKCCRIGEFLHCCPEDAECCGETCCAEGQACCDGKCKTPEECCKDCGPCEKCDRSDPPNVTCKPDPVKEGTTCGALACGSRCKDGTCTPIKKGETCPDGHPCCGQLCCDGECLPDGSCCMRGGFFAAEASVCCPAGPPCGDGAAARCCDDGETCCAGLCKDRCGECPDHLVCGDACCVQGETCTSDGCCLRSHRCPASGLLPEGLAGVLCCAGPGLCGGLDVAVAVCCAAGEEICRNGCCPTGTICDNRCRDELGEGVGCCRAPGPDPVPAVCERFGCSAPVPGRMSGG